MAYVDTVQEEIKAQESKKPEEVSKMHGWASFLDVANQRKRERSLATFIIRPYQINRWFGALFSQKKLKTPS